MSNKECDIVQDLLPLYYDNACSEESRRFVEKHLPGCNDCQKMYNELKENNLINKDVFIFTIIGSNFIQILFSI